MLPFSSHSPFSSKQIANFPKFLFILTSTNLANQVTTIPKQSPFTANEHFEKLVHTSALLEHFGYVFLLLPRKNRLRHLERLCTKCHQVLRLRLRTSAEASPLGQVLMLLQ